MGTLTEFLDSTVDKTLDTQEDKVICPECGKEFVAKVGKTTCPHCQHHFEVYPIPLKK